jgi:hypothetical protein
LHAELDDSAVREPPGLRRASNPVKPTVTVESVRPLTIVEANAYEPIVSRVFQAEARDLLEQCLGLRGRPIEERAEVALVLATRVERIVAIESEAVLARLQVLEAVWNLRLSDPNAPILAFAETDVRVSVTKLVWLEPGGVTPKSGWM